MKAPAYRIVQIDKQTGDGLCISFYDDKAAALIADGKYLRTQHERYKYVLERNVDPVFHGGKP